VLEADGISREMVEAQRTRVELISRMAEAFEQGEEQLAALVNEQKALLDQEFFGTLNAFIEASAQSGREDSAQMLRTLRDKLVELSGFEGELPEAAEDLPVDEVVDRLANVDDSQLEETIAELRPLIDYAFYEALTKRIDAAEQSGDTATAEHLTKRRSQILELVERMDRQAQELFEAGAKVLQSVLEADDPEALMRSQPDMINEAFMLVLDANMGAAERAGARDAVERLVKIRELAIQIAQEALSPEDRFINDLLQAETPQDATKLLRQNVAMIKPELVKRLNELADQFEKDGRKPLSDRLRQLGREAGAMLF
jgi:uncharacterized protein YicC (UPF0701 family)